jgi:type II secretory ATPase GspE/PulE/Tfp pilus assembly ATPase PilB-like protein
MMVDCRVSTLPMIRGEKVVIRLLPTSRTVANFEKLGFREKDIETMLAALSVPSGLFLVVGPTGSGKSTTLYAGVETFGGLANNTITIEDPVEIKNEFLTQVQVNTNSKDEDLQLTEEKILVAVLRQAPNNILLGEIRDGRRGEICIEAAQTGHRVLSTVHATDVITALLRLFTMGINRASLLTNLNCIVAQRLVAKLCPHCSQDFVPTVNRFLREEDVAILKKGTPKMASEEGCSYCDYHGYYGRMVISEVVRFDNELRDFYMEKDRGIKEQIAFLKKEYGYRSLRESAVDLMTQGVLSLDEFIRVIGN